MPTFNSVISRSEAQALMPEEVSREIWKNMPQASAAMTLFKSRRLSRAQQRVPVLSVLPTAYFVNGDTGLKQTTEQNWSNKYFNVEEIACIVPIPEAVLDDSDYDIWAEIRPNIEESIGRTLDAAVFFGTNKPSSWPTDIVASAVSAGNVVARGTNATSAGGLAGDFSDLFGTVEADGFDVNGVLATRAYRGRLRQVRDTQGRQQQEVRSQVSTDEIFGVPVQYPMRGMWPTGSSAAEAIAGDFSEGMLAIRQDITYKMLTEAVIQDGAGAIVYNLAQQDMVALRVVFRCAWQVSNAINYDQQTEANRYPFAALRSP